MATIHTKIDKPVGTRNGTTPMLNLQSDLDKIAELFDRIPAVEMGTANRPGAWAKERALLVPQITAQIVAFQTRQKRPRVDGVIDPGGGTLGVMNRLAADPPLRAVVAPAPGGRAEVMTDSFFVAQPATVPGRLPLRRGAMGTTYVRKLVRVDQSSIRWFGVALPVPLAHGLVPHVFFTPTPHQGNYYDGTYSGFEAWGQLWDDYTSRMGAQIHAAGARQILVIPFYRNAQSQSLGQFSSHWAEVVSQVVTAAIDSVDPLFLRDRYTFDRIVSSSFSNGWIAHRNFNSAPGAAAMTSASIDLDGAAAKPSSLNWRPANGLKYINAPPRAGLPNPAGSDIYVGGRWEDIAQLYAPADRTKTHFMCSAHLLFDAVTRTGL